MNEDREVNRIGENGGTDAHFAAFVREDTSTALDVRKLALLLWSRGRGEPSPHTLRAWESDIAEFLIWLDQVDRSDRMNRSAAAKGPRSSLKEQVPIMALVRFVDGIAEEPSTGTGTGGLMAMLEAYRRWASEVLNPRLSAATLTRRLTTMRKLADTAVRQGWVRGQSGQIGQSAVRKRSGRTARAVAPSAISTAADNEELPPLSEEEIEKLLSAPDETSLRGMRDYALLLLLLDTGFHRHDACALNVDDFVNVDQGATSRKRRRPGPHSNTAAGAGGSAGSSGALIFSRDGDIDNGADRKDGATSIRLSPTCTRALSAYRTKAQAFVDRDLEGGEEQETGRGPIPLFRSLDHRPANRNERLTVDGVYALIRRYSKKIGIEVTPRRLRRTALHRLRSAR